jgi:hypothetical protein
MAGDIGADAARLLDRIAALLGHEHAITLVLLLPGVVVRTLDQRLGVEWRTRSDGGIAFVPTDADIGDVFDASVVAFGHERAVAFMTRLDWRAARALDRRRPGWRDQTDSTTSRISSP